MQAAAQQIHALDVKLAATQKVLRRRLKAKQRQQHQKQLRALQTERDALMYAATTPRDGVTRWWLRAELEQHLQKLKD